MEHVNHTKDLSRCLKRLERSDTPLTRKNARAELWKKLSEIRNDCSELYPLIGEDGEAKPVPIPPPPCPFCGIPTKSWDSFTRHVAIKHGGGKRGCWCGKQFDHTRGLANHFKGLRAAKVDIKDHVTRGILAQGIQPDLEKSILITAVTRKFSIKGVKP
jgi:hypothetical protein